MKRMEKSENKLTYTCHKDLLSLDDDTIKIENEKPDLMKRNYPDVSYFPDDKFFMEVIRKITLSQKKS